MKFAQIAAIAVFLAGAPALACADAVEVEDAFVACLAKKNPASITEIRDAESQELFEAAMKKALEICPTPSEKMSMGRLFKALNAHKQEDSNA